MLIKIELSEEDLEIVCRILSDAADYAGDMAREEEDEEDLESYTDDSLNCRRIAGYLQTESLIAAIREFQARTFQSPN